MNAAETIMVMSSPLGHTSEMRSQDSYRASSQQAVGVVLEDTASSAHVPDRIAGSSVTISSSRAPNTMFTS